MSFLVRKTRRDSVEKENVEKLIQNWNPPKVPIHRVYKKSGFFESNKNYEIKTTEKAVIIQGEYQELQLHDRYSIQNYKRKYAFLHMGFVQVAIKPLTMNGMKNTGLVALRDGRCLNFNQSLIAIAEFSLNNGPVYFNCYPNFMVSLTDPHVLQTLTLNMKIHGYNSEVHKGSRDIEVVYKVYYKLMLFCGNPKAIEFHSAGYTSFIDTNLASNNVAVEKTAEWESIEIPEIWKARPQQ